MNHSRKPVGRLPQHLQHLSKAKATPKKTDRSTDKKSAGSAKESAASTPTSDRITQLLPELLRAMIGERAEHSRIGNAPLVLDQEHILAALAPYYRPKSRFEGLVMRRLVGDGYLRPRGPRDKHGLSGAYELTPKGERVAKCTE